jgi:hypothetical protein
MPLPPAEWDLAPNVEMDPHSRGMQKLGVTGIDRSITPYFFGCFFVFFSHMNRKGVSAMVLICR